MGAHDSNYYSPRCYFSAKNFTTDGTEVTDREGRKSVVSSFHPCDQRSPCDGSNPWSFAPSVEALPRCEICGWIR
jgi:hypothetical protein